MNKVKICSLLIGSLLSVCAPLAVQAETISIKLGHVAPTDEPYHQAAEKFAELVKTYTNGAVEVQIFPNSLLGGQRELLEGLQLNSVDATLTTAAVLANFLPKTQVIELPFMFRDREHVYKVVDGPLAAEIYAGDESKKMKVIDTWENGFRNITNNVRPIEKPEDMKGIKIRVMENKMYIDMFKALGANPTPMARGEVFTALQTKTIDAQENPLGQITTSRFYEVQKYLTLSRHTYSPEALVFSLATWNRIPPQHQEAIRRASAEAKAFNRELSARMEDEYLAKLRDNGMTVTTPTPQEVAAFQEKMTPVWDTYSDKIGKDLIRKIKETR